MSTFWAGVNLSIWTQMPQLPSPKSLQCTLLCASFTSYYVICFHGVVCLFHCNHGNSQFVLHTSLTIAVTGREPTQPTIQLGSNNCKARDASNVPLMVKYSEVDFDDPHQCCRNLVTHTRFTTRGSLNTYPCLRKEADFINGWSITCITKLKGDSNAQDAGSSNSKNVTDVRRTCVWNSVRPPKSWKLNTVPHYSTLLPRPRKTDTMVS